MRTVILKYAENHPSHTLVITSNSFGDQLLSIVYETIEGYRKNVWFELNHEGSHRSITNEFVYYLKNSTLIEVS